MMVRHKFLAGALGGIAGGLVFGVLMATMGMLDMIAEMAGLDGWLVGLVIHLMMSVVIGIGFTLFFSEFASRSAGHSLALGAIYSSAWWVMGILVALPLMSGAEPFQIGSVELMSLMGHLIFGLVLALVSQRVSKIDRRKNA